MSLELLIQADDRLTNALIFHSQNRDLFLFLALVGFAEQHNYQYIEEGYTKRQVKGHIITMYGYIPQDKSTNDINLIESLINGRKQSQLSSNQKWHILQSAYSEYLKWEADTLNLYSQIGKALVESNDMSDYGLIQKIINDVAEEYAFISKIGDQLSFMEYDSAQVIGMQTEIQNLFRKKLKHLYKDIPPI